MERLCPTRILCPGPQPGLEADSPITNYSSEYTDGPEFFSPVFAYWNPFDPGLPAWWTQESCLGIPVISTISQDDADLAALRVGVLCSNNPPDPLPPLPTLCEDIASSMQQYEDAGDTVNFNIYRDLYMTVCLGEQPPFVAFSCDQLAALVQSLSGSPDPTDRSNAAMAQALYNTKCTHHPSRRGGSLFFNSDYSFTANCADGFEGGTVNVPAGTFAADSQVLADRMAQNYAQKLALEKIVCPSAINGFSCANQPYSDTITVTGQAFPFVISLDSGTLPPGLALIQTSDTTARINGTPTTAGTYAFSVSVTGVSGTSVIRNYTINVLGITNLDSLPQGTVGVVFFAFPLAAAGGVAPYTFAISAGALPDGLSMDISGNITGTPTTAQTSAFVIAITDSSP